MASTNRDKLLLFHFRYPLFVLPDFSGLSMWWTVGGPFLSPVIREKSFNFLPFSMVAAVACNVWPSLYWGGSFHLVGSEILSWRHVVFYQMLSLCVGWSFGLGLLCWCGISCLLICICGTLHITGWIPLNHSEYSFQCATGLGLPIFCWRFLLLCSLVILTCIF